MATGKGQEKEPDEISQLEEFLEGLGISAAEMDEESKVLYFKLVTGSVFPRFFKLGEQVAEKGRAFPYGYEVPMGYSCSVSIDGLLSLGVHSYTEPEPVSIADEEVGRSIATVHVSNYASSMAFQLLNDGRVTFEDSHREGTTRLLDSPESMFELMDCNPLFPTGNPAAWVNMVITLGLIQQMESKLETMDVRA